MQNGTLTHASTSYDQQPAKDQASVIVKIPGYNESCTVLQVQRVLAGDWLDSELISFFMTLLSLRNDTAFSQRRTSRRISFLSTYFYCSWSNYITSKEENPPKRRRCKGKEVSINHPCNWIKHNPSELSELVIPINVNSNHWILCVIDFLKGVITSYDPLNHKQHTTTCESLKSLVT